MAGNLPCCELVSYQGAELTRIRLLQHSTLTRSELDAGPLGRAHEWLWQDGRIDRVHRSGIRSSTPHPTDWVAGLSRLRVGSIDALLWMREDVQVHDYLLADRILALSPGAWQVCDAQGQLALQITTCPTAQASGYASSKSLPIAVSVPGPDGPVALTAPLIQIPLLLVTATRVAAERFYEDTALGSSVQKLRKMGLTVRVMARCNNRQALAKVYNAAIRPEFADHIVVFAHDDITLHDWHLATHLKIALQQHDVVGLAGNKIFTATQPGWAFPDAVGQWAPASQLLGCIGHDTLMNTSAKRKVRMLSRYGAPSGPASLLDGVFLASQIDTLLRTALRFDPELAFHFYDLDFCRNALKRGLQPGVSPLAVTHYSGGAFGTLSWRLAYQRYCHKWGDADKL